MDSMSKRASCDSLKTCARYIINLRTLAADDGPGETDADGGTDDPVEPGEPGAHGAHGDGGARSAGGDGNASSTGGERDGLIASVVNGADGDRNGISVPSLALRMRRR